MKYKSLKERMKDDEILRGSETKREIIADEFNKFLDNIAKYGIDLNYFSASWTYEDGKYACCGGFGLLPKD